MPLLERCLSDGNVLETDAPVGPEIRTCLADATKKVQIERLEPRRGLVFRDDGEDLDFVAFDVIEHPEVVHATPAVRMARAAETFDSI